MKNCALIGAAGYVAPRHMHAIKKSGNRLVAALDPNDSVGIIDSYFPNADFFTEFERFDRYIDKLKRNQDAKKVDLISICSPNYLHDSHVRFALRSDADVVCEKPLVLNPWNIDGLISLERDTGRRVNTILQLRLHPSIIKLKETVENSRPDKKVDVDLTYITSRGNWYHHSWKGDLKKSGGIATNIGVHFFDMLHYLFGQVNASVVHHSGDCRSGGFLEYDKARVRWFLSVEESDLPIEVRGRGQRTFRSITINEQEVEFSGGFSDLHDRSYAEILAGRGFSLEDNRVAVETVSTIRNAKPIGLNGDCHPFIHKIGKKS